MRVPIAPSYKRGIRPSGIRERKTELSHIGRPWFSDCGTLCKASGDFSTRVPNADSRTMGECDRHRCPALSFRWIYTLGTNPDLSPIFFVGLPSISSSGRIGRHRSSVDSPSIESRIRQGKVYPISGKKNT